MNIFRFVAPLFFCLCCTNANAALILNKDNSLAISEFSIAETFQNFYDYSGNVVNSSNTGFEDVNTAVFLIASFNNELALIATFGAFIDDGDNDGGRLNLQLTNNGFGDFLFIDDGGDPKSSISNVTTIDFSYFTDRTDGFIYSLGNGNNVDLELIFSDIVGVDSFIFLNEGEQSINLGSAFSISTLQVSEPSTILLGAVSFLFLMLRRRF